VVTKSVLRPPAAHAVAGGLLEPALRGWAGCTRISPLVSCLTRRLRTETPERGLTKGSSQRVRIGVCERDVQRRNERRRGSRVDQNVCDRDKQRRRGSRVD
jgi:hypothetical protein